MLQDSLLGATLEKFKKTIKARNSNHDRICLVDYFVFSFCLIYEVFGGFIPRCIRIQFTRNNL